MMAFAFFSTDQAEGAQMIQPSLYLDSAQGPQQVDPKGQSNAACYGGDENHAGG